MFFLVRYYSFDVGRAILRQMKPKMGKTTLMLNETDSSTDI